MIALVLPLLASSVVPRDHQRLKRVRELAKRHRRIRASYHRLCKVREHLRTEQHSINARLKQKLSLKEHLQTITRLKRLNQSLKLYQRVLKNAGVRVCRPRSGQASLLGGWECGCGMHCCLPPMSPVALESTYIYSLCHHVSHLAGSVFVSEAWDGRTWPPLHSIGSDGVPELGMPCTCIPYTKPQKPSRL